MQELFHAVLGPSAETAAAISTFLLTRMPRWAHPILSLLAPLLDLYVDETVAATLATTLTPAELESQRMTLVLVAVEALVEHVIHGSRPRHGTGPAMSWHWAGFCADGRIRAQPSTHSGVSIERQTCAALRCKRGGPRAPVVCTPHVVLHARRRVSRVQRAVLLFVDDLHMGDQWSVHMLRRFLEAFHNFHIIVTVGTSGKSAGHSEARPLPQNPPSTPPHPIPPHPYPHMPSHARTICHTCTISPRDERSALFTAALTARLACQAMSLVAGVRSTVVELAALDRFDVARFIAEATSAASVDPLVVDTLYDETQGVPIQLRDIIANLMQAGLLWCSLPSRPRPCPCPALPACAHAARACGSILGQRCRYENKHVSFAAAGKGRAVSHAMRADAVIVAATAIVALLNG